MDGQTDRQIDGYRLSLQHRCEHSWAYWVTKLDEANVVARFNLANVFDNTVE